MARKNITSLVGNDPKYSKQFENTPPVEPKSKPKMATPEGNQQKAKPAPEPKPVIAAEPAPKPTVKPERNTTTAPRKPSKEAKAPAKSEATRAIHVRAVPRADQKPGLDKLEKAGLPATDVVRLAGKRAMDKFELKPKYVPTEKTDRLPTDLSFRTMKTLSASTLDALRDEVDPLRLRSDAAVIQGQLEPIFWAELDAVIKELGKKYS